MTAAFFVTLAVAVVVLAVLIWRELTRRSALDQARQDVAAATERAEEATRFREEAEAAVQEQIAAMDERTAEMNAAHDEQVASAETRLAALQATSDARIEGLERDLHTTEAELAEERSTDAGQESDTGWPLLLARIERQWADVVNAGPGERGVVNASRREQLIQAVQRDLERLREEVGVETTMAASEPVDNDNPLTTLLAVGEAVALLAYHSEHVQVDLRDPTTVSGQDWTGDDNARRLLEQFAATASDAGLDASVEVADRSAQVLLGRRPNPPSD